MSGGGRPLPLVHLLHAPPQGLALPLFPAQLPPLPSLEGLRLQSSCPPEPCGASLPPGRTGMPEDSGEPELRVRDLVQGSRSPAVPPQPQQNQGSGLAPGIAPGVTGLNQGALGMSPSSPRLLGRAACSAPSWQSSHLPGPGASQVEVVCLVRLPMCSVRAGLRVAWGPGQQVTVHLGTPGLADRHGLSLLSWSAGSEVSSAPMVGVGHQGAWTR